MDGRQRAGAPGITSRLWVLALVAALTLAVLPFRHVMVGANPSFMPAFMALVVAGQGLTAFLLFQQWNTYGRPRTLAVAVAYLFSAAIVIANALAFPGVASATGPLSVNPSTSVWLWCMWHGGFPLLITAGLLGEPVVARLARKRRSMLALGLASGLGLAMAATALVVTLGSHLPVVIRNNDFSTLLHTAGWWVIGLNVAALAVTAWKTRSDHNIERWTLVAVAVSLSDVLVTLLAGERFTLGWYASRAFCATAAGAVLIALFVEMTKLYRKAENDKSALEDEAISLLRDKRTLQYREDRVRRIIDNAADAYIELDRDGLVQGWNVKAAEMFGWSASDVLGRSVLEIIDPGNGNSVGGHIDALWNSEQRFDGIRFESNVLHRAGHEFPIECTAWADEFDLEPKLSMFVRDITVRRDAEAKLQHALTEEQNAVFRLQEIDQAKSDFVSSISHELRSPLTSTLGYLEMLADGDAGDLNDQQAHMVNVADRNAKRLMTLIEDLLTLSNIESGDFGVKYRPVELRSLIEAAVHSQLHAAEERSIGLTLEVEGLLGVCPGDNTQLQRALTSVISNAVKFTPPNGKVSVVATAQDEQLLLRVTDDGIGIPVAEQSKLFQRFFRTSLSVEQQHQGAGLGLTIAKAIVEHHNGSIEVESTLGQGTTVSIVLPMLPAFVSLDQS